MRIFNRRVVLLMFSILTMNACTSDTSNIDNFLLATLENSKKGNYRFACEDAIIMYDVFSLKNYENGNDPKIKANGDKLNVALVKNLNNFKEKNKELFENEESKKAIGNALGEFPKLSVRLVNYNMSLDEVKQEFCK